MTLKNVTTDIGRGRAWLRSSLNEKSLERYLSLLLANPKDAAVFYHHWAVLMDDELNSVLPNMAAGVSAILFAIVIDDEKFNYYPGEKSLAGSPKTEPVLSVPIEGSNCFLVAYFSTHLRIRDILLHCRK